MNRQEAMRKVGLSNKGRKPWNKGLTKEDDSRIRGVGNRKGCISWCKGLTKETDSRLMHSESAKNRIGVASKERWTNEEYIMKMACRKTNAGFTHTEETKRILRLAAINEWKDLELRKKRGQISRKLWEDPEYRDNIVSKVMKANGVKPNKLEIRLADALNNEFPGYLKFVGDGSFLVGGSSPDFINVEKKQIIEVFGCYWHCCRKHFPNIKDRDSIIRKQHRKDQRRVNKFKKLGYSVLIIWEHEIIDDLQSVIKRIEQWLN